MSRLAGLELSSLYPGYFALVMATGIMSTAALRWEQSAVSGALLGIAGAGYLVLVILHLARLALRTAAVRSDLEDPTAAFGFFTFVAATQVLAHRLLLDGAAAIAGWLWAVGTAAWLGLTYGIFGMLALHNDRPLGQAVNGSWFIAAVATQSVALGTLGVASSGSAPWTREWTLFAWCLWASGVVLYTMIACTVLQGLWFQKLDPTALTPPYWIAMGAAAISALAGARLAASTLSDQGLLAALKPFTLGVTLMLWSWATWLIPLLILFGLWKHAWRGVPITYHPSVWSIVFPLGMYSVTCAELGSLTGWNTLGALSLIFYYAALGVGCLSFAGMLSSWRGRYGRRLKYPA